VFATEADDMPPPVGSTYYLIKTTSSSKNIPVGPLEQSQSHCDAVIEFCAVAIRPHRVPLATSSDNALNSLDLRWAIPECLAADHVCLPKTLQNL
jgi:hypothetical protein